MISARPLHLAISAFTAAVTAVALSLSLVPTASAVSLGAPSGVDVSSNNHHGIGDIDWNAVKTDGQSYAFVKATEGEGWANQYFVADANAAKAAGLQVGAYHYARPAADPARQAADFAAQLALVPGQTLPPVLDLEVDEGKTPQELIDWTRTFTSELRRLTGRTPMIYTYRYFWTDYMANTTEFSEFPLWLAAYQDRAPEPMGGWDKIAFWQRSDSGRVNGITGNVDMNLFNGTDAHLQSFAAGNYIDFGGILENLVIPGVDLSGDAGALIAAILVLGAGVAAAPAVAQAAKDAGVGTGGNQLVTKAAELLNSGAISPEQLQRMADSHASIGDLTIMLDNAQHLHDSGIDAAQVDRVSNAARGVGIDVPALDSEGIADTVNHFVASVVRS